MVHDLGTRCSLACKVNSKTPWVCKVNLVKQVKYKARDLIKFEGGKESIGFNVI